MEIINEIISKDLVIGSLAMEALNCFHEGKNMAALASLFICTEQAIKLGLDRTEGNFNKLIKIARNEKRISEREFESLEILREIRNKLFHENHYMGYLEKNGINYPFSEKETKKIMFEDFSLVCFKIVSKLI